MNKHIVILTNADIEEYFGPVYVFDDEQSASNFQRQVLDHIRDGERRSGVDSEYWPIIKRATPVTISPLPPANTKDAALATLNKDAALATLNKAATQIYNIEGDQWQEAYETIEAVIDKLKQQSNQH